MNMESIKLTQESPETKEVVKEYQFHFEEIGDLHYSIKEILSELHDNIEAGEYQLIIGDDASGRIPALILNNVIKERYRTMGYRKPEIGFIAGTGASHKDIRRTGKEVSERIEYIGKVKDRIARGGGELKKALIVTDTVSSGRSLDELVEALAVHNTRYDVATISAVNARSLRGAPSRWSPPPDKFVYGSIGGTLIYGQHKLAGVKKREGDLYARTLKERVIESEKREIAEKKIYKEKWELGTLERLMSMIQRKFGDNEIEADPKIQQVINEAREDVKVLSEQLMNWYNKKLAGVE